MTFDEWYLKNCFRFEEEIYKVDQYDSWFSLSGMERVLKEAWEASRQNMTYKDI